MQSNNWRNYHQIKFILQNYFKSEVIQKASFQAVPGPFQQQLNALLKYYYYTEIQKQTDKHIVIEYLTVILQEHKKNQDILNEELIFITQNYPNFKSNEFVHEFMGGYPGKNTKDLRWVLRNHRNENLYHSIYYDSYTFNYYDVIENPITDINLFLSKMRNKYPTMTNTDILASYIILVVRYQFKNLYPTVLKIYSLIKHENNVKVYEATFELIQAGLIRQNSKVLGQTAGHYFNASQYNYRPLNCPIPAAI